jgi:deoxycytidylate deaminase
MQAPAAAVAAALAAQARSRDPSTKVGCAL